MKRIAVVTLLLISCLIGGRDLHAQAVTQEPSTVQPPEEPQANPARPTDEAPKHVSTGWRALFKDTVRDVKSLPRRRSTWVILGIGGGAAFASSFADDYIQEHIVGNANADRFFSLGQWLGSSYAMAASSVGLWAVGRYVVAPAGDGPKTNKWSEMGFDMMRAQMLSQAITHGTKNIVRRDRPTGECCSFPSGHATAAFAAASVLERHLGYRASWPFFVGATYVGTSRLVDNRHFLSDVMFGAAIGTATGWTVVGRKGPNALTIEPVPIKSGMMINVATVPRRK